MGAELFQLNFLFRDLDDDVVLAEALGFPELSTAAASREEARTQLVAKARLFLADPELAPAHQLHRRRLVSSLETGCLDVVFDPPTRSPQWLEPASWRVHYVWWEEGGFCHAFAPGLPVHVFAPRAQLLPARLEESVRLQLAGRGRHLLLQHLAALARARSLTVETVSIPVTRRTPKELAVAEAAPAAQASVLAKVAEAWQTETAPGEARPSDKKHAAEEAFGLEAELAHLAGLLSSPQRRSILVVGPAGCGKTALVREWARRRHAWSMGSTAVWSTTGARLMMGPLGFGMWEERCTQLCQELMRSGGLLHVASLLELFEVGRVERSDPSVAGFLRPWMARGDIQVIAESTPEQMSVLEREEPHVFSAFQVYRLAERTSPQTRAILGDAWAASSGQRPATLAATEAALDRMHQLHERYATYSARPGRVLRFLRRLLEEHHPQKELSEALVLAAFTRETGLPLVLLDEAQPLVLDEARRWFAERVIGQPAATERVVDLLAVMKARLARPRKPLASFLFMGPTGTGKTELAKTLAEFLFGEAKRMVRFDLNEFSDSLSVQRLMGGPAIGRAEGLLTARIREQPFSVVLLDEFEKADPAFYDLLLQILGEGRLTDAAGRVADFCNAVIVMTSNLGAREFQRGRTGFRQDNQHGDDAHAHFTEAARKFLRPEIFNRLDAIVPFQPLGRKEVLHIARRHLELLRQRDGLRLRPVEWLVRPEVAGCLAERGYDVRYGARPLKRTLERELLVPLAEALNEYSRETPVTVTLSAARGRLEVRVRAQEGVAADSRVDGAAGLATEVVAARRQTGRLRQSRAVASLQDELALLAAQERRLRRAQRTEVDIRLQLPRLAKVRACLERLHGLEERAQRLEGDFLTLFYGRQVIDEQPWQREVAEVAEERRQLAREVFRMQRQAPDDVVLAFYSEHVETLLFFANAYFQFATRRGQVVGLVLFPPPLKPRRGELRWERQTPAKPADFWAKPPSKLIGLAMHLRGDLFFPMLSPEAGLHVRREKNAERDCLVETASPPLSHYAPPAGMERLGAIHALRPPPCRAFDTQRSVAEDGVLGERPWSGESIDRCLEALLLERLEKIIAEATTQEA